MEGKEAEGEHGVQPKAPAKRKKEKPEAKSVKVEYLINWKAAADAIEAELKAKDWDSVKQRRNPQLIFGLVSRHIIRPLVKAINSHKGV